MNKMNRKMEYALMSLRLMAQKSGAERTSAKEISEVLNISFETTARVLQSLSSRGLLKAEYGVSGGYLLAKPLVEVSLHDLFEMLENGNTLTKCLGSDEICDISASCNIAEPILNLNKRIQDFYKSISLAEVLHV